MESEPDGSEFVGMFDNGLRNGQGKQTYPDGTIYEGNWENAMRQGHGKVVWAADQTTFEGKFEADEMTFGTMRWVDGNSQNGEWKEGNWVAAT